MNTAILIPARLASTRFPKKVIAELLGKPLINHVYDKCIETDLPVYVVTDSEELKDYIPSQKVIVTGPAENGTERCRQALQYLNYSNFINVQGDMPDITVDIINTVHRLLKDNELATVYTEMDSKQRRDPNSVKLIHNGKYAHWFCRASLEYGDHHLGIYGYRNYTLNQYNSLQRFPEEDVEKLEQLRWLQNSHKIAVAKVDFNGIEINTKEDLEQWHLEQ